MVSDLIKTVFIVRHGERLDHIDKSWQPDPSQGIWDPPLTSVGFEQAKRTGATLRNMTKKHKEDDDQSAAATYIIIYTSPFQRCIDTSLGLIRGFCTSNKTTDDTEEELSFTLKLDLGLTEWMSESLFEEGIDCSASQFLTRQHEKLARQQAYTYSVSAASRNSKKFITGDIDESLILPPALQIDYAYRNPNFTELEFPENYNDMIQRFEQTRRSCLKNAAIQQQDHYSSIKSSTDNVIVIFVTHAVGVNALLDGFRNQTTIPLESKYCSISCLRRLSSSTSDSTSMLTYTSDQSDVQSEDDELAEYYDDGIDDRRKRQGSLVQQQLQQSPHDQTATPTISKEMWSIQCTMSDSHLSHLTS
ncbi:histidine phosphatase superfamily [Mycotypha africana]|uniref:histidine phosphatase superfamily n=1 Tax=Mycotypha africana TaxID=64632 RepID=UPI002300C381|nr:histidine phosphatase superfamily [Mycotypha africana]KAI8977057.1 histidine phosphatase superfamily [Mycotypha africana]